jgi:LacI family transcriptional regulator
MATIVDVAHTAKVSIATVSAVLNGNKFVSEELRGRVLKAIEDTGYHPHGIARSLKNGRTKTIGLVVTDVTNPYSTAVARSIEDAAHAEGYTVILCNSDEDFGKEETYLGLMRTRRVDGLILAPSGKPEDYRDTLEELRMPVVLVDRTIEGLDLDAIVVNNLEASRQGIEYLLGLGHTRIGAIVGPQHLSTSRERLAGYRQALSAAGLPFDEDLVCHGNFRHEDAYQAGLGLLRRANRPTAVFASNNLMALGILRAVQEIGLRCPEDISIIAFDDFDGAALFRPALTTIAQPTTEIGRMAVDRLLAQLRRQAGNSPRRKVMSATFNIRGSCGRPPQAAAAARADEGSRP